MDRMPISMHMAQRFDEEAPEIATTEQRNFLLRRLADLAIMPPGLMTGQERGLVASVVASAASRLDADARRVLSERICDLPEGPYELALALAHDELFVAEPILRHSIALEESDLIALIHMGEEPRCAIIAERKTVPALVVDTLVKYASPAVICRLIENSGAVISKKTMDVLVRRSAAEPEFISRLIQREELGIRLAQMMFWWSPSEIRSEILQRFSVERRGMHAALREALEPGIAGAGADDALRMMLSVVRSPRPVAKIEFAQILKAASQKSEAMFLTLLSDEARIRSETILRILQDQGGEPLSILGKAMGLSRREFGEFIVAAIGFRESGLPDSAGVERMIEVFDSMSIDRADLVLHCWDWAVASEAELPLPGEESETPAD